MINESPAFPVPSRDGNLVGRRQAGSVPILLGSPNTLEINELKGPPQVVGKESVKEKWRF